MATTTEQFRRHVNAAASALTSAGRGGRNARGSWDCAEYHAQRAQRLLTADAQADASPLCDYLDSPRGARLAEKWNGVERRLVGLPV